MKENKHTSCFIIKQDFCRALTKTVHSDFVEITSALVVTGAFVVVVSGIFSHFLFLSFHFSPGSQGDIQYLNPSKVFPGFSVGLVTSGFPVESGPSGRPVESGPSGLPVESGPSGLPVESGPLLPAVVVSLIGLAPVVTAG